MNVLGYQPVPLADLPDDGARPDALTDAIGSSWLIHEPMVRVMPDGSLVTVAGRRRIAAHRELKHSTIVCKLVECTDDEATLSALMENHYRSDMTGAERAQAIREIFAVLRRIQGRPVPPEPAPEPAVEHPPTLAKSPDERTKETHPKRKRGARRSPEERAVRAEVGAVLGVGRQVVAEALDGPPPSKRPASDETPKEEVTAPEPPPAPTLDTFGLDLDPAWTAAVGAYDAALCDAHQRLTGASTVLGRLLGDLEAQTAAGPARRVERLREELRALLAKVTGARPVALCWYCKGADAVSERCAACGGCGVGVRDQRDGVPAELSDAAHLRIADGGEIVDMPGWEPPADDGDPWPVGGE